MLPKVMFPKAGLDAISQNHEVIRSLQSWTEDHAFKELLSVFGYHLEGNTFREYLESVHAFTNRYFDYYENSRQFAAKIGENDAQWLKENEFVIAGLLDRFRIDDLEGLTNLLGSNERRFVFDDAFLVENRPLLAKLITETGLPGDEDLIAYGKNHMCETDWLVILGGASATNEIRTKLAYELCREHTPSVAGLTAERLSNQREKTIRNKEYEQIRTEFDSMKMNMEIQFDMSFSDCDVNDAFSLGQSEFGDDLTKWPQTALNRAGRHCAIDNYHVISAPSSDWERRRANTIDTLDCFIDKCVALPSKVMLISSSRYIPYTVFSLWKHYRIDRKMYDLDFMITGNAGPVSDREMIASYLLELRNGVNAGYELFKAMELSGLL